MFEAIKAAASRCPFANLPSIYATGARDHARHDASWLKPQQVVGCSLPRDGTAARATRHLGLRDDKRVLETSSSLTRVTQRSRDTQETHLLFALRPLRSFARAGVSVVSWRLPSRMKTTSPARRSLHVERVGVAVDICDRLPGDLTMTSPFFNPKVSAARRRLRRYSNLHLGGEVGDRTGGSYAVAVRRRCADRL